MNIYTIGVYGFTPDQFFEKLIENKIDLFIDIRRRRAVRGSTFSFVNSKKLQQKLETLGIEYIHVLDLAPTNEIRDLQKETDRNEGIHKRERLGLGDVFIKEYKERVLKKYDLKDLVSQLAKSHSKKPVLFCVEREPKACHRSLVANELKNQFSATIIDL
ncbi:DUF488 family protein [Spirosoma sp. HMF3257]|uniref:DUF488 domain-containing protein n=1 Tax=Spirosoma telluris TaxID=2183553 RepID=A0A327NLE0_9BACT|nr:DUF488 family protein [Spirosoma telluris]RAI74886.1 DUF488 domain-containing protein [Spirosoma telluris]